MDTIRNQGRKLTGDTRGMASDYKQEKSSSFKIKQEMTRQMTRQNMEKISFIDKILCNFI